METQLLAMRSLFRILREAGVDFASSVPCSVQKELVRLLDADPAVHHIPATREDEALGMAAGAFLGGMTPVVSMSNSGLASCMNVLLTLCIPYRIAPLLLVSWRGEPGGAQDAPHQSEIGRATEALLRVAGVKYYALDPRDPEGGVRQALDDISRSRLPSALLISRAAQDA